MKLHWGFVVGDVIVSKTSRSRQKGVLARLYDVDKDVFMYAFNDNTMMYKYLCEIDFIKLEQE